MAKIIEIEAEVAFPGEAMVDRTEQESNKSSEETEVKAKESSELSRKNLQRIIHRESVSDSERYN